MERYQTAVHRVDSGKGLMAGANLRTLRLPHFCRMKVRVQFYAQLRD